MATVAYSDGLTATGMFVRSEKHAAGTWYKVTETRQSVENRGTLSVVDAGASYSVRRRKRKRVRLFAMSRSRRSWQ